ncbi:hypothetical protein C8R46DRAFT_1048671 [Mycena filopes]|nr:hypothetical protein C8R46DRAFT_1048671 [Mycena filopes]
MSPTASGSWAFPRRVSFFISLSTRCTHRSPPDPETAWSVGGPWPNLIGTAPSSLIRRRGGHNRPSGGTRARSTNSGRRYSLPDVREWRPNRRRAAGGNALLGRTAACPSRASGSSPFLDRPRVATNCGQCQGTASPSLTRRGGHPHYRTASVVLNSGFMVLQVI